MPHRLRFSPHSARHYAHGCDWDSRRSACLARKQDGCKLQKKAVLQGKTYLLFMNFLLGLYEFSAVMVI